MCAARRLAERGIKPVLVDADANRPRLSKRLGVRPQRGWDEVTPDAVETTLAQVIVESTANNMALLPLADPPDDADPPMVDFTRLSGCLDALRGNYDAVLVDVGPLENAGIWEGLAGGGLFQSIDALVLVRDHRITSQERLGEIQQQLAAAGIRLAGIVENFVPA